MSYLQRGFGPLCTTIKPVNKVVVHGRLQLNSVVSQCHQQTERERNPRGSGCVAADKTHCTRSLPALRVTVLGKAKPGARSVPATCGIWQATHGQLTF